MQQPRKFTDSIRRVLYVFKPFDTHNCIERIVVIRQPRVQIARPDLKTIQLEYFRIKVAAGNVVTQPREAQCERTLAGRNVQETSSRPSAKDLFFFKQKTAYEMCFSSVRRRMGNAAQLLPPRGPYDIGRWDHPLSNV